MVPRLTKYGPCACVFLCLLLAPSFFSWIVALWSPEEVVVDLRGMDIPAVYKEAKHLEDGSVDLTINIPASVNVLKRLMDAQEQVKHNLTAAKSHHYQQQQTETPHQPSNENKDPLTPQPPQQPQQQKKSAKAITDERIAEEANVKTYYPVTLDSPYILNSPRVCEGVYPLHVLVIVHTATANFQRRRLIRETWAGKHLMNTRTQRLLFLLGLSPNATLQRMIENERLVYGDLVQGKFKDTYHNLTHKGVMAYRWIHQHCPHAQLILKVDDDMYINPFLLYDVYFPRLQPRNRTIACHVRPVNTSPIQRRKGKWAVEDYEFRGYKHYPVRYCNGYVVIITPDIIKAMYSAAYTTPFFWVDDVYLYGMLPSKVGNVSYVSIEANMTLHMKTGLNCYNKPRCHLFATHAPQEASLNDLWHLSLGQIPDALKPQVNPVYLVT